MNTVIVLYSVSVPTRVLASTALVLSAGFASAQVSLSGDARMGLIYNGDDVQLTSRARVTFTLSGETDTGLAFGASFRADNAANSAGTGANANTRMGAGTVFISGDFGKLTFGDVDSAARAAAGDLYGVGLTGLGDLHEVAYLDRIGGAGVYTGQAYTTAALYEYSIDGFTGYVGLSQNNVDRSTPGVVVRDNMLSVGAKYSFDGLTAAVGYEHSRARETGVPSSTSSHLVASIEYAMDGIKGKLFAGRAGGDLGDALALAPGASRGHYGLSVAGSFDATTVTAFAYRDNFKNTQAGIGASYDLGGGASIKGGIVRQDLGATRNTTADFGLAFTF